MMTERLEISQEFQTYNLRDGLRSLSGCTTLPLYYRFRSVRMASLPLVPGDTGPMVQQMQGAIIAKGFSVGPAGADGDFNSDTLSGLQAFQDDNALPVQAKCDQQCWTALGLPGP
jgi:peptidoglycan hydrolase-like protein with peptidoglycan-binding domain